VALHKTFLLAAALGVDAMILAFGLGLIARSEHRTLALRLGSWFGGLQALMATAGLLLALGLGTQVSWVSQLAGPIFILLGLKLLWDAFHHEELAKLPQRRREFLLLALAVSLDALAAGLSFTDWSSGLLAACLIGAVAFAMSFAGALLSQRLRHFPERALEIGAALVLIFLGAEALGLLSW